MAYLRTCVDPTGCFVWGVHRPNLHAANLREKDALAPLGTLTDGTVHINHANFPQTDIIENQAQWIYEIPNALPFRGTTYIMRRQADARAVCPDAICLPEAKGGSLTKALNRWLGSDRLGKDKRRQAFDHLPGGLLLALATTSDDPEDLVLLAEMSCTILHDPNTGRPTGLLYDKGLDGKIKPLIFSHLLFEAVANNPLLPEVYKQVMVLRPGVQGESGITGEWTAGSHSYEYLRCNSYIPWGHYAANMADDAVRYDLADLSVEDMTGLRHLYYQRTYVRLAKELGIPVPIRRRSLSADELETLRQAIGRAIGQGAVPFFTSTLWGWNYGFDYAPSHYRLHASHQQIHQQYALVPGSIPLEGRSDGGFLESYACGDMVEAFVNAFRGRTGRDFFDCYEKAIRTNQRIDGNVSRSSALIVFENPKAMVFVPKAQTSQWEIQVMPRSPVGNVLEADPDQRACLDVALLVAARILAAMGVRMVCTIEYAKRFDRRENGQRLLYALLPRLPESPGAFSEAQLRWINGHYPEDFAAACRHHLPRVLEAIGRKS
jgi:hypothetical protein